MVDKLKQSEFNKLFLISTLRLYLLSHLSFLFTHTLTKYQPCCFEMHVTQYRSQLFLVAASNLLLVLAAVVFVVGACCCGVCCCYLSLSLLSLDCIKTCTFDFMIFNVLLLCDFQITYSFTFLESL